MKILQFWDSEIIQRRPYPSQIVCVGMDDDPPANDAVQPVQRDLSVGQLEPEHIWGDIFPIIRPF